MNIVIKLASDSYFLNKLNEGQFSRDDLLICGKTSFSTDAFSPDNIFSLAGGNAINKFKSIIINARKLKTKSMLCVVDQPLSKLFKLALYFLSVLCFTSFKIGNVSYGFLNALWDTFSLLLSPFIAILLTPLFLIREVLSNFILPREKDDKPFIGFGMNGRLSGVIYWYLYANRAKRHGLFGYAFNEYMGFPVSLYHFPFSIFMIKQFKFRLTFLFGALLLFVSLFALYYKIALISPWQIAACFFFFMLANTIWEHASLGVYEILAWGLGLSGFVLFIYGNIYIAGLFWGLLVLSHVGVASLLVFFIAVYALLHGKFFDLFPAGIIAFFVASCWIVPFVMQIRKMTRMKMINKGWSSKYSFGYLRLLQFLLYLLFVLSLFFYSRSLVVLAMAMCPVIISYINAKIKVLFSLYTVRMFQTVVGILCLAYAFNMISLVLLLFFLFLPPYLLSWENHEDNYYYKFKLNTREDLIKKANNLFGKLSAVDRVGFELGSVKSGRNIHSETLSEYFSLYLADKNCEIFNSAMVELIKFDLYEKTCAYFNCASSYDELKQAILASGITHIVAFTEPFKKKLDEFGFIALGEEPFIEDYESKLADFKVVLYAIPFINEKSFPFAKVEAGTSSLKITFASDGDHIIKYSFDFGLHCTQGGKELKIEDDGNGYLKICCAKKGEAVVTQRYTDLFFPSKDITA
ncbi:MAG: hypothetical protein WC890_01015 [Candidatus Margulisiibacteriota bacterium]